MPGLDNQFYRDNAPNYDEFRVLSSLFEGLTDVFDEMMSQAIDNSKISTMRAFTKIPIQIINVVDACYSLSTLLANKEVLNTTGIDPNLSIQERMNVWNDLDPKIRATALEQMGLVLMLVNPNILKGENVYTDTFKVVDFEMYDYNTGDRLIYGLDYYYEYNKIYFLRFGSQTNKYNNKKIVLKNITIDNNTPEKILGESLGIYANSNFSPTEYRDIITSFASAALAGPVINTINQSFNPDINLNLTTRTYGLNDDENSLKGIKVIDYKSADDVRKRFWDKQVDGINRLNAFDFLVTIPSDYLYKTEKMEYVQQFVKKMKPAQSNFVLSPEYFLKDTLSLRYSNFSFRTEGEMKGIRDKIKYKERYSIPTSHITKDNIDLKPDFVYKKQKHTTEDYLNIVNMAHFFEYSSSLAKKDRIECKEESNIKNVYLECITRVHVARNTYHVSDEVLLDTDWFDCLIFFDDFHAKSIGHMYDKIPTMKTGNFKMAWVKFLEDKIPAKDIPHLIMQIAFNEKIDITYRDGYEHAIATDVDMFLDTIYMNDFYVESSGVKSIKDNVVATETIDSLQLNADNLYDKIINRDDPKGCMITEFKDTLSFVKKSNISKCDSIYSSDYEEETAFYLDTDDGVQADENVIGYEEIVIKLIPKN